jgi:hypothetical protein
MDERLKVLGVIIHHFTEKFLPVKKYSLPFIGLTPNLCDSYSEHLWKNDPLFGTDF